MGQTFLSARLFARQARMPAPRDDGMTMRSPLTIAGCQFSVDGAIAQNRDGVLRPICEAALSGYAGCDMDSFEGFDWGLLREATRSVCRAAAEHRVWVLLGSAHRLSGGHKPHNCVYVISDAGEIVDRYDKRFCTGAA